PPLSPSLQACSLCYTEQRHPLSFPTRRSSDLNWAWHSMDGSIRPRYGNWDLAINIYAVNPCKDGYMMVGGGHDRLWYRIWRTDADRKSTRLNSSHQIISYAVFCLTQKNIMDCS